MLPNMHRMCSDSVLMMVKLAAADVYSVVATKAK